MNETWQPVRIAPPSESMICATSEEQRENCTKTAGSIIRVQQQSGICTTCGGNLLTVHPEDFRNLGIRSDLARIICQSQVQAD